MSLLLTTSIATAHSPVLSRPGHHGPTYKPADNVYLDPLKWKTADGKSFELKELMGKKSIITLFYTSCRTICPMTVDNLKEVEAALGDKAKDVEFVLVTIDPQDGQKQLKEFKEKHGINRWKVVSGSVKATRQLAADLGIGYGDKPGATELHQMHSLAYVVVDEKGKVLGNLPTMKTEIEKAKALLN